MGEYANVKIKKLLNFIKRLVSRNKDLQLVQGGRHNYLVKYPFWSRPFPIPFKQTRDFGLLYIIDLAGWFFYFPAYAGETRNKCELSTTSVVFLYLDFW